jgi:hypothetical protein
MDEIKFGFAYHMKDGESWIVDKEWNAEDGHVRLQVTIQDADRNVRTLDLSKRDCLEKRSGT